MFAPVSKTLHPSRPYWLWPLWLGFAFAAISGWMRMANAITDWYWLAQAGITPGPLYLAVTGGLWGLVGTVSLIWMLFNCRWSRVVGLAAALFFALTYWIDRIFVVENANNLPFAIGFTLFCLVYVWLVLQPLNQVRALLEHKPA